MIEAYLKATADHDRELSALGGREFSTEELPKVLTADEYSLLCRYPIGPYSHFMAPGKFFDGRTYMLRITDCYGPGEAGTVLGYVLRDPTEIYIHLLRGNRG